MDKIIRVSGYFRRFFTIMLYILPILYIVFWFILGYYMQGIGVEMYAGNLPAISSLTPGIKILGFLVSLIGLTFSMLMIYYLAKLFRLYEKAKIFSSQNVQCIRRLGYVLVFSQVAAPIQEALMSFVLTLNNGPGKHMVEISFGNPNFSTLITGFIIILAAWVMNEGRKLKDEQELVV